MVPADVLSATLSVPVVGSSRCGASHAAGARETRESSPVRRRRVVAGVFMMPASVSTSRAGVAGRRRPRIRAAQAGCNRPAVTVFRPVAVTLAAMNRRSWQMSAAVRLYGAVALAAVVEAVLVLRLWRADLRVQINHRGAGVFFEMLVKPAVDNG